MILSRFYPQRKVQTPSDASTIFIALAPLGWDLLLSSLKLLPEGVISRGFWGGSASGRRGPLYTEGPNVLYQLWPYHKFLKVDPTKGGGTLIATQV